MDCKTLRQLRDEYRDGALDGAASHELEQHLADCPACEKLWRSESAWLSLLAEKTPVGSQREAQTFTAGVVRRWTRPRQTGVLARIGRFAAAAAVIALVLSIPALILTQNPPHAQIAATTPKHAPSHPVSVLFSQARQGLDLPRNALQQSAAYLDFDRYFSTWTDPYSAFDLSDFEKAFEPSTF